MPKNKKSAKNPSPGKLVWDGTLRGILVQSRTNVSPVIEVKLNGRGGSLYAVVGGDTMRAEAADIAYFHEKMLEIGKILGISASKIHTDAAQF